MCEAAAQLPYYAAAESANATVSYYCIWYGGGFVSGGCVLVTAFLIVVIINLFSGFTMHFFIGSYAQLPSVQYRRFFNWNFILVWSYFIFIICWLVGFDHTVWGRFLSWGLSIFLHFLYSSLIYVLITNSSFYGALFRVVFLPIVCFPSWGYSCFSWFS